MLFPFMPLLYEHWCTGILPILVGALGAAGAGINAASQGSSNAANAAEAQKSREFNWQSMNRQIDYGYEMSTTAYQRARGDMEKAGLNPIMMANQGGASAPSVSQASAPVGNAQQSTRMGDTLGGLVSTAMDGMRLNAELNSADAKQKLDGATALAQTAQAASSTQSARNAEIVGKKLEAELPADKAKALRDKGQFDWDSRMQKFDNVAKRIQEAMGIGSSAKDILMGPWKGLFDRIMPKGPSGGGGPPKTEGDWNKHWQKHRYIGPGG